MGRQRDSRERAGGTCPPGRPRSAAADRAILEAALRLLGEQGYRGMSMEGIAEAAGVGKATLYRRYHDKADVAAAAVETLRPLVQPPDRGDPRGEATEFLEQMIERIGSDVALSMIGTLLTERHGEPRLIERWRARVIVPRQGQLREVLRRGVRHGELRADADLELAVDLLVGGYVARRLSGSPVDADWAGRAIAAVWAWHGARV
jgi:AcrR family transcriptional regulator